MNLAGEFLDALAPKVRRGRGFSPREALRLFVEWTAGEERFGEVELRDIEEEAQLRRDRGHPPGANFWQRVWLLIRDARRLH